MAVGLGLLVIVLAIQHGLKDHRQIDVATAERMQQREEYLHEKMTQLLQEIEASKCTWEDWLLRSVLQHWPLLSTAGAMLLLAEICWLGREVNFASDSCSDQDSSSSEEEKEKEEDEQEEEDLSCVNSLVASPMQVLPDTCKGLKKLVGDLLSMCQVVSKRTLMPQMQAAVGMDDTYETWRIHEDSISYRLLVFLQPPPGYSFSLEPATTGQLAARRCSVRVGLECMCWREQLLGDSLCFLHHPDDKLRTDQSSYLLRTLCTCSYLDVEKIACWAQRLVRSAWLLFPQSRVCQLTVLPSSQSCRFQLTSTSKMNICTEMTFAVQQGSSVSYLSLE
ncbi:PREDICTED: inositol 1,4,5-trisphosphate receptor-interacting protein-like 1 [Chlamydotis macqueenii]|uniref:inositol 1,4,5-trisphosphate receptor-interacting protein-like 1 n=1 Tax=Chlamydotis macqueenii TaxID=187382 RepID=UPI000529EFC3|nr:PREDICTED: inositol 1,4,5-trisphosphate receptor-interacting protein-like 1 [Chlamydotis macqueenii]